MEASERYRLATSKVAEAIQEHRRAFVEMFYAEADIPREVLAEWAVIGSYIGYDEEGDQTNIYHVILPDDELAEHRLRGLWHQGLELLREHNDTS